MRIEDTDGVASRAQGVRRAHTSGTGASMVPGESRPVPHRFRGVDVRVLFAAHCTGLAVDDLDVHDIETTHGHVRVIEMTTWDHARARARSPLPPHDTPLRERNDGGTPGDSHHDPHLHVPTTL